MRASVERSGISGLFVLLWSSGYIVGGLAVLEASPLVLNTWRFVGAAAILAVIGVVARAPWPHSWAALWPLAATGITFHGLQAFGVYIGLSLGVSAAQTALLMANGPLVVAFAAHKLMGEPFTRRQQLGVALGLAGVLAAVSDEMNSRISLAGLCFTILGLIGFSAGTLIQRRFGGNMDLRTGLCLQFVAAAGFLAVTSAAYDGLSFPLAGQAIAPVLWLVLVNSIGAKALLFFLLRTRHASATVSLFFLIPPVTALLAVPVLGQPLTGRTVVGLLLASFGVYLVTAQTPAPEKVSGKASGDER